MSEQFSATVTYNRSDFRAVGRYMWPVILKFGSIGLGVYLLFALTSDIVDAGDVRAGLARFDFLTFSIGALFGVAFAFLYLTSGFRAARKAGTLGPHRITIEKSGIHSTNAFGDFRYNWATIRRVEADAKRLFLFTNSRCAIIVPVGSMDQSDKFDACIAQSRAWWAAARTKIPAE